MRFKLKLKKSRQYNVTSRSLFVISVEHLIDSSSNVECTLSSESTGQECLENVCQRLSIGQPEFFGLRYLMKGYTNDYRWVDLEMPLSRQLEKFAATPRLFLRVMYYVVGGVNLLTDEATRYYYFLQVRGDVVDGRIQCDPAQAVLLAVCARHAEYDKSQRDQHTVDYLKAMLPLPRRYVEAGMAEKLAEEVLQHTAEMAGVGQVAAEEMFLRTAQQLEGYGQERFPAKDRAGQEVLLGNSVLGIAVMYVAEEEAAAATTNGAAATAVRIFNWRDISNVLNLKQSFIIECTQPENTCEFTLQDAESGRYFWKLCVLQHKFYSKYEQIFSQQLAQQQQLPSPLTVLLQSMHARRRSNSTISVMRRESNQMSIGNSNGQAGAGGRDSSLENLLLVDQQQQQQSQLAWRNSDQHLAHEMPMAPHRWRSQDSVLMPPHHQPHAHSHVQQHKSFSNLHLPNVMEVQQSPSGGNPVNPHSMMNGGGGGAGVAGQLMGLNHSPMVTQTYNWQAIHSSAQRLAGSNVSLNGGGGGGGGLSASQRMLQGSSSCLDLSGGGRTGAGISNSCTNVNSYNDHQGGHGSGQVGGALKAMLPGYRKAPDYETAVRQKYQRHVSGSQPDVYQASSSSNTVANQVAAFHLMRQQQQQQQKPTYPDVTQTNNAQQIYNNTPATATTNGGDPSGSSTRYMNGQAGGGFNNNGSKLNQIVQQQQQQMRVLRLSNGNVIDEIKPPPPPYPNPNRLSSTSTPDLALISHRSLLLGYRGSYVSGSSPDLVSSRTLLNNHHQHQLMQLQQQNNRNSGTVSGMTTPGYMKSTSSIGPQNYYINGQAGGGGGNIPHPPGSAMRHSHSILPHGTYENLNCIEQADLNQISASHSNLYQKQPPGTNNSNAEQHMLLSQRLLINGSAGNLNANATATSSQQLQQQVHQSANVSQSKQQASTNSNTTNNLTTNAPATVLAMMSSSCSNLNNSGVIEPIYENLPLSCWSSSSTSNGGGNTGTGEDGEGAQQQQQSSTTMTNSHNNNNQNQNQVTVTHTSAFESPAAVPVLPPPITGNGVNLSGGVVAAVDPSQSTTTTNSVSGLSSTVEVSAAAVVGSVGSGEEMRDRASSVQSAPAGGVRGSYRSTAEDDVIVSIVEEQRQKKKLGEGGDEQQQVTKRPVSKTWSNPVVVTNKHVFQATVNSTEMTSTVNNGLVAMGRESVENEKKKMMKSKTPATKSTSSVFSMGSSKSKAPIPSGAKVTTSPLNRSQSANLLDTSQSSQFTVDSGNISASTSNASIANTTASSSAVHVKEKRRGIWSILSRGKSSNSSSSSFGGSTSSASNTKHGKSATLGKSSKSNLSLLSRDEEDNLKRWATGLPRMEPLSANMSKEQLGRLLEQKKNDDDSLFREFERIPVRKEHAKYECALNEENRARNSDSQCLPHDDNRVRLLPTRSNRLGYVNASHLSATVGSNQRFYIVAQSPFDAETMNAFWQCVWEADVYLIIQLSNELQYVPSSSDKCLEFGQYQVWREFSQETDYYVTSKLRIYHVQAKRYRIIWYIHYSDWSEQNIPRSVAPFLEFLEELSSVRMASADEIPAGHNTNPPVLIHCNGSGGGRSGVTLAADLLLFTLDHNQDLDIPRVVGQLRHQRDNIVPSLVQYKFIYSLLCYYLKQNRLI